MSTVQSFQKAVEDMMEDLQRHHLIPRQKEAFLCSARCCDPSVNLQAIQQCTNRCDSLIVATQNVIYNNLREFQERFQRCAQRCEDTAKDSLSPNPQREDIQKAQAAMAQCLDVCAGEYAGKLPRLKQQVESQLTTAFALPVLQIVHETLRKRSQPSPGTGFTGTHEGGASAPGAWQMSVDDKDPMLAIDKDGLRCQCQLDRAWAGGRATAGVLGGKVYYEATVCHEGLSRVGWSTRAGALDLGTDRHGFGYGSTGKKSHQRQFDSYGEPYGQGDVIGCLLDCSEMTISFTKNGRDLGLAFELPRHVQGQETHMLPNPPDDLR